MRPIIMPKSPEQVRARAARKRAKERRIVKDRLAANARATKASAQDAADARVLAKYHRDNDIVLHADESLVTDAECRRAKRMFPENSGARVAWLQGQSAQRNIARHDAERRAKRAKDRRGPMVSAIVTTATMNAILFAVVLSALAFVLPDAQMDLALLFAALLFTARIFLTAVTRTPA